MNESKCHSRSFKRAFVGSLRVEIFQNGNAFNQSNKFCFVSVEKKKRGWRTTDRSKKKKNSLMSSEISQKLICHTNTAERTPTDTVQLPLQTQTTPMVYESNCSNVTQGKFPSFSGQVAFCRAVVVCGGIIRGPAIHSCSRPPTWFIRPCLTVKYKKTTKKGKTSSYQQLILHCRLHS